MAVCMVVLQQPSNQQHPAVCRLGYGWPCMGLELRVIDGCCSRAAAAYGDPNISSGDFPFLQLYSYNVRVI